jgi:hypothetical protein
VGQGGTPRLGDCNFFYGKGSKYHQLEIRFFFMQHRLVPAVKREKFVSDRMSYVQS